MTVPICLDYPDFRSVNPKVWAEAEETLLVILKKLSWSFSLSMNIILTSSSMICSVRERVKASGQPRAPERLC